MAKAMAGIGQKRADRPSFGGSVKLVDTVEGGKVGLDSVDLCSESLEVLRCIMNSRLISGDHQVVPILGAELCKFVPDTRRRAGYDGKRLCCFWHGILSGG